MTLVKRLISGFENIDQQTRRVQQVILFPINFEPPKARLKQVSLLNCGAGLPEFSWAAESTFIEKSDTVCFTSHKWLIICSIPLG